MNKKKLTPTFTEKVYLAVQKIPKGSVSTYKEIAQKINHPNAARAVGSALKKNFDPSIPCHRVIKSNGELGEYNRGTQAKKQVLNREGYKS